jgi:geranylgeranyl transferase type-2 subunit beta
MSGYLEQLSLRIGSGMGRLHAPWRQRHAGYLLAQQQPDGGFPGREGPSDLYYTSFALRGLALLGQLEGEVARRAAGFLQARLSGQVPIVDFLSLIYGAAQLDMAAGLDVFAGAPAGWRQAVAKALEQLRRPDGGYAKTPDGQSSSLYHSFLLVLSQQLLDLPTPEPQRLIAFVRSRRRDDGGFVEMEPMRRSGTNPTAAAVGLLTIHSALDEAARADTAHFLLDMQNDEGGWRANSRVPIADLLSTFTALVTLSDLGSLQDVELEGVQRYVELLQLPGGGFHGAAWDAGCDVEYTFYGLGASALLAELTGQQA